MAPKNNKNARHVSNKPAPKPPKGKQKGKPEVKDEEIELDEESDEDEEEVESEEDDEEVEVEATDPKTGKKVRKSQKMRVIGTLLRGEKQFKRLLEKVSNTPELQTLARAALKSIEDVRERAEKLPEDWKRAASDRPTKTFSPGDIVSIGEAHRAKYDGLLDKDEFDDLTVIKQIDKKLVLRTRKNNRTFFPIFHVVAAPK